MSNIYIQEPPSNGKVLLETTVGDIDIELWSRECPKACRNFIQLCMEGYYDGTKFHRLVKEFIVQGGDPAGTGTGGQSIWDKPFKDEFHSRLRFIRRGLVAMANGGRDDNGSQFFFTLAPTPELQNKHTLFGKVGGDTIYNMIKLAESETDGNERPLHPHKILKTKILNNPFEDIVPRKSIRVETEGKKKNVSTAAATKNYSLLSFGEEAEEEEEEVDLLKQKFSGRGKSSHDLTRDPKLSTELAVDPNSLKPKKDSDTEKEEVTKKGSGSDVEESPAEPTFVSDDLNTIKAKLKAKDKVGKAKKILPTEKEGSGSDEEDYYLGKEEQLAEKEKLDKIKREYKQLKREMREDKTAKIKAEKEEEEKEDELESSNSLAKSYFEEQKLYKEKQSKVKKGTDREEQTLALLQKFQSKVSSVISATEESGETIAVTQSEAEKPKREIGKLYEDDADDDPNDTSWFAKSLHNEVEQPVLAKDANKKADDWYEIYDPKNPLNRRRREESKKAETERWKKFKPTD